MKTLQVDQISTADYKGKRRRVPLVLILKLVENLDSICIILASQNHSANSPDTVIKRPHVAGAKVPPRCAQGHA